MLRIISGTIALLCAFVAFCRTPADTIKVYFEVNHYDFNPDLFNNASVMERFIEKIDSADSAGTIESIDVYGYSSPEGSHRHNRQLSDRRCRTIADYIIARTGVDPAIVATHSMGEAWNELRAMVEANPEVPYRSRVLDIIDNTPEWVFDSAGRIVSGRKKQLMDLAGGRPYRWLLANIFPKLRYALTVSVQYASVEEPEAGTAPAPVDSVCIVDTVSAHNATLPVPDTSLMDESLTATVGDVCKPLHRLAVKTNMLYDAVLLPNVMVEWRINRDWSVGLEGDVAWWGNKSKEKSYRLGVFMPEVKRWIRPRSPWHGLYVGLFAGGGYYDLENETNGYYGEGAMAGLSVGYMWPVSRCLSLEAEVGGGYLYSHCKEYKPFEGHHVYQRTKNINYFGPLRVSFSLVWRLWDVNKPACLNAQIRNGGAYER